MSNTRNTTASARLKSVVRQAWRDTLSVYYANTPVWRWLKSGALVFFGFFLWTGGSVLLSYQTEWTFLSYVIAYGFLLLIWGPLTHFIVVPLAIRSRRSARRPWVQRLARQASKINVATFLVLVVLFGTVTPGVMMLEFSTVLGNGDGGSASANVVCEYDESIVTCTMENPVGFDHAVLLSGGAELDRVEESTAEESTAELSANRSDLAETRSGADVVVELRDKDGKTVRRYVRTIPA